MNLNLVSTVKTCLDVVVEINCNCIVCDFIKLFYILVWFLSKFGIIEKLIQVYLKLDSL